MKDSPAHVGTAIDFAMFDAVVARNGLRTCLCKGCRANGNGQRGNGDFRPATDAFGPQFRRHGNTPDGSQHRESWSDRLAQALIDVMLCFDGAINFKAYS